MVTKVNLGLDVGGTACRWVACDEAGAVLARGKVAGATAHVFNPAERQRLGATLTQVAAALGSAGLAANSVTAGLTGYGSAVSDDIRAMLGELFGLDFTAILVMDDIVLAYLANFAPGEGHLVSAGTGSIGLHLGEGDDYVRVGGRGILIDDAGSGSWIALRALDALYRALDHSGSFDAVDILARQLFGEIGGNDWHDVRQFVYAGDRGSIGTLAVAVARAADEGDAVAMAILHDAAVELSQLGQALVARVGNRPIGFTGGVLRLHPLITAEIGRQLAGHDVRWLEADAGLAAARLSASGDARWRQVLAARSSIG
jgi:glucosamine kinase